MFRTSRSLEECTRPWRITLSALPLLALLLYLIIPLPTVPALAQEEANGDYYTIKYDQHGNKLWHATYEGDEWDYAYGVAVDSAGNVIVTGASEIWHVYHEDGEAVGTGNATTTVFNLKHLPITAESEKIYLDGVETTDYEIDYASGAVTFTAAPGEGVVITADYDYEALNYDYYTIKYDSNGNKLWELAYDAGGRDEAFAVAVDSYGNIIVGGRASEDFCLIKYSPEGNQLWPQPVVYDGGDADGANSMAVDSQDDIIITGYSTIWHDYDQDGQKDDGETNLDYYTVKYDRDGNKLWSKAYDQGHNDGALEVVVDSASNVIVTGGCGRWHDDDQDGKEDEGEVDSDYCTIKYDQHGNQVWDEPLFYDSQHPDTAYGVAVDSQNNIIVTGSYSTPPPQVQPGTIALPQTHGYITIKYDSEGNQIWKVTYDGAGQENVYDVAVDSENNIIVTGKDSSGGSWNYYTIKYREDGKELWDRTYDGGQWDSALDVVVDSADNIIVTGSSQAPSGVDGNGGTPAESGGLPTGAIVGIAMGGCAAVGLAYYYLVYQRERLLPRAERRRRAAKQRKKAA